MSNKSRRRKPRPTMVNEQMMGELRAKGMDFGSLSREQAVFVAVSFAVNQEKMWNSPEAPPFMQATVERRSTGVSLHVDVVEPSGVDAEVVG